MSMISGSVLCYSFVMRYAFITLGFLMLCCLPFAAANAEEYEVGTVVEVLERGEDPDLGSYERLRVVRTNGEIIEVEAGDIYEESAFQDFAPGDEMIIKRTSGEEFVFVERYRLSALFLAFLLFALLVLWTTKKQGFFALAGLVISALVIFFVLVPLILSGFSAIWAGVIAGVLIAAGSITLAHGFRLSTGVALMSIAAIMVAAALLAFLATWTMSLFGHGEDATLQSQLAGIGNADFRGIFLAGVLLGTLGVLDDVIITQVATVAALRKANPELKAEQLYEEASHVGKSHLISMVNTLFLAYAGVSLPLILLFSVGHLPWWVLLNSEMIAEEIVRTLVGSAVLFLAIPLSTFWASRIFVRRDPKSLARASESHHH